MRFNREKVAAGLALLILVLGLKSSLLDWGNPGELGGGPDATIPKTSRELVYRKQRTYTRAVPPDRSPFAYSEGWQALDAQPLPPPPLSPPPLPAPGLSFSAPREEIGVRFRRPIPLPAKKETAERTRRGR